ncbi:acetyltransferase [Brevundimonas sp.]|uniref:acetyltransferase n=1 Tax=Brevundimonas sp. TaxID=1871086 RepID=UPI002D2973A8|nr:acetyltransferase [Brevundimonas sp.]HYC75281.1 acetyltransferase [Brevundimonas sp.]
MIRLATAADGPRTLEIWRRAVAATHDFVSASDLTRIDGIVVDWLATSRPWVHVDETDTAVGFMALTGAHVDALFVDPARHGAGVGRALIAHARTLHGALTVDVNEQNARAVGFYERLGFQRTGRSPTDGLGMPYPLLHMTWRA